ncbi:class I SAM-dependent methyltransferase [Treponema sp.]|uniref:class I SAM-dependent methyltransferase n=1 Tax=Treponema sp. TaxID=166 RepID=UPI00298E982F|nr:class I SAM-dependent methyltransferase [Treponema sp.]MCR5613180.1 class I SAM-dependent methyltransferase [Treponema sp.]
MDRISKINSYYEKNFQELQKLHMYLNNAVRSNVNADNYRLLGWESRQAQYARFAAFVKNVALDGTSVLDVGCGLGDLFHFMTCGIGLNVEYTGIDISKRMIAIACEQLAILRENGLRLPEGNKSTVRFVCKDVFEESEADAATTESRVDWVYASGIFNLNLGNNDEFLRKAFLRFAGLCKKGFVCSMLNVRSTDKEDTYYYYEPSAVSALAKEYGAKNVRIVDDYLENDFTIIAEM